jgi:hypothetical protein
MKTQAIKPVMRAVFNVIAEKQFKEMQVNRPYFDAIKFSDVLHKIEKATGLEILK